MWTRNKAYDHGVFKSSTFSIPVIAIGNLNVGGTGKSPMIEYLATMLQDRFKMAILSRGYGRRTRGFVLADEKSTAREIGDEPLQFKRKFNEVIVAVDENRAEGIGILTKNEEVELVLLDDAFQHRKVRAGLYVLLTTYHDLYVNDFVLPTGNLREPISGSSRADIIVVTKCPLDLAEKEKDGIRKKLTPANGQQLFFSGIDYAEEVLGKKGSIRLDNLRSCAVLLVTGIANTEPLERFLHQRGILFSHLKNRDHKDLKDSEIMAIRNNFQEMQSEDKIILTTEKDYVRNFLNTDLPVYYLPIRSIILGDQDKFENSILDYVRKDQGDG